MTVLRKILFVLFTLIYLVLCPLVVLYALGIIFNPQTQTMEQTGIIYLSSIPPKARVRINSRRFPERTPTIIRNLGPGSYRIQLALRGHKNWEKTLPVREQKATSVEDILLIPQKWPIQETALAFEQLIPFPKYPFSLLQKGPLIEDLYVYRGTSMEPGEILIQGQKRLEKKIVPLAQEDSPFRKDKIRRITTTASSPLILVEALHEGKPSYLWLNLKKTAPEPKDITKLIFGQPEKILWDRENARHLYLLQDRQLSRVDLEKEAVYPNILSDIKAFTFFNNELYVLTLDNDFLRTQADGGNPQALMDAASVKERLFSPHTDFEIAVFPDNLIVFLSEQGALLLNQLPHLFVEKDARGFDYDQRNRRLLFWTSSRIGYIDLKPSEENPLFEEGPRLIWLNGGRPNIQEAFWVNNGENVVGRTAREVFITETESFEQPVVESIVKIKSQSLIHYQDSDGVIFFLDRRKGNFSAATVVPKVFPGPVPEVPAESQNKKEQNNAI